MMVVVMWMTVLCALETFLGSAAILSAFLQFVEIGKVVVIGRRIVGRKAHQRFGLGWEDKSKRTRSCNPKQTFHKDSSIHSYFLLAMFIYNETVTRRANGCSERTRT
jgi:hypothetical protein